MKGRCNHRIGCSLLHNKLKENDRKWSKSILATNSFVFTNYVYGENDKKKLGFTCIK